MPFESTITQAIIKYIKSIGGEAEKVKGGASSSGRPDINACYLGRCIRIETKTPDNKNKASIKQQYNLKRWEKSGAVGIIAYSKKSVEYFLNLVKNEKSGVFKYCENKGCKSIAIIPRISSYTGVEYYDFE